MCTKRGLGIIQSSGHVDFYPNGGSNQPGCSSSVGAICSHFRAVEYFIETLSEKLYSHAFPCSSLDNFKAGQCFKDAELLGDDWVLHNSNPGQSLYLLTRSQAPFIGKAEPSIEDR